MFFAISSTIAPTSAPKTVSEREITTIRYTHLSHVSGEGTTSADFTGSMSGGFVLPTFCGNAILIVSPCLLASNYLNSNDHLIACLDSIWGKSGPAVEGHLWTFCYYTQMTPLRFGGFYLPTRRLSRPIELTIWASRL
jgi:hypothetical protein